MANRSGIPRAKLYQRGDRLYVQAQQIWLILSAFVQFAPPQSGQSLRRKTLTYGDLAREMGFEDGRAGHTLGRQLGIVGQYCIFNDLPPLNVIVVTAATGEPGDEVLLRKGRTVRDEQKAVMAQRWFDVRVPTTGTLRQVWEAM